MHFVVESRESEELDHNQRIDIVERVNGAVGLHEVVHVVMFDEARLLLDHIWVWPCDLQVMPCPNLLVHKGTLHHDIVSRPLVE